MSIQETTDIPEVKETIVKLRELSADEKVRQEAYYREKQLHDEASALKAAEQKGKTEGKAIMLKQLVSLGHTVKQLSSIFNMPEKEIEDLLAIS